jgi:phosphatidylglycerophosphatase A
MVAVALLGWLAVKLYARTTDNPDPSEVVIDEVLGMAIVGLCIPFTFGYWLTGFVLFRIFDSIKRGPVGWCDKNIKGAFGIMFDDVVAALLASAVIFVLYFILQ